LSDFGLRSFKQALDSIAAQKIKCASLEHFILNILAYPTDLKRKAQILINILEIVPMTNELISRINCWKIVYEDLFSNKILKEIVAITRKLNVLLN
jgi:hypothetical protein